MVEFDLKDVARKTINGCDILDFCAENLMEGEGTREDIPDEYILNVELGAWKMYFDRVLN